MVKKINHSDTPNPYKQKDGIKLRSTKAIQTSIFDTNRALLNVFGRGFEQLTTLARNVGLFKFSDNNETHSFESKKVISNFRNSAKNTSSSSKMEPLEILKVKLEDDNPDNNQEIPKILNCLYSRFCPLMEDKPLETPESIIASRRGYVKWMDLSDYKEKMDSLGDIVLVDDRFKLLYGCNYEQGYAERGQEAANKTYQFFVGQHHIDISSIKYSDVSRMSTDFSDGHFLIRFKLKNNKKFTFLIKKDENKEIEVMLHELSRILKGNSLEVSKRKKVRHDLTYNYYWGGHWEEVPHVHAHYENSDRLFQIKFEQHILNLQNKNGMLTILDVGAGKGRLAAKLIMLAQTRQIPIHYILLEPEKSQCITAKEKMDTLSQKFGRAFVCRTTIINSSIEEFSTTELYNAYLGKIDGIISSGGPINEDIVSFDKSQSNLSILKNLLHNKGVLIASGLTPLHFNRKSFQKFGFNILNMSEKQEGDDKNKLIQFYIFTKKHLINPWSVTANFNHQTINNASISSLDNHLYKMFYANVQKISRAVPSIFEILRENIGNPSKRQKR